MMDRRATLPLLLLGASLALGAGACERENRHLEGGGPGAPTERVSEGVLQPGPTLITDSAAGPYDNNAYATAVGQQLFTTMNCSGCHSNGGGGMGPALMDEQWIYGSEPQQIFASIAEGRPNGMPSWKYRLNDKQIWELVAYVRSLSGLTPKGARPGRMDHMMTSPAPNQTPNAKPKNTGLPNASKQP